MQIIGTDGNDVLYGNYLDDTILAGAGDDRVYGGSGDDWLAGGDGLDTLDGGEGDDRVDLGRGSATGMGSADGGSGTDTVVADFSNLIGAVSIQSVLPGVVAAWVGGTACIAGMETYALTGSQAGDTLVTSSGDDLLAGGGGNDLLSAGPGNDTVSGGDGDDRVDLGTGTAGSADGGSGQDTLLVDFSGAAAAVVFQAGAADASSAGATILTQRGFEVFHVVGSPFHDTLAGGAGNDSLTGGGGSDSLAGGGGNDWLDMGKGRGNAAGGVGTDTLGADFSSEGAGVIFNAASASVTTVGSVVALAHSGLEVFRITGTSHSDVMTGGAGNDTLSGGAGNDSLNGGTGNDWIDMGAGRGLATGGTGVDTLGADFSGETGVVFGAATGRATTSGGTTVLTHSGFESFQVSGSPGTDTLAGGDGNDWLDMGAGRGLASGGAGADTLGADFSGEGTGVVFRAATGTALAGGNQVLAHSGFESFHVRGTAFNDTMAGGSGNDWLDLGMGSGLASGGAGTDMLAVDFSNQNPGVVFSATGSAVTADGANVITHSGFEVFRVAGSARGDTLSGGAADDTLSGGLGDDLIDMRGGGGEAGGGNGWDTLRADFSAVTTAVVADLASASIWTDGHPLLGISGFEAFAITGSGVNDILLGSTGYDTLLGGGGVDSISGYAGDDSIHGGAGNDTLVDMEGNNTLRGEDGNDSLSGNNVSTVDAVLIDGGGGDDTLLAMSQGIIEVTGGDGKDLVVTGGVPTGSVAGGEGDDTLDANFYFTTSGASLLASRADVSDGDRRMYTHAGFEVFKISGGYHDDTFAGGSGNDSISGYLGNDSISGGVGNDTLDGGPDNDILNGGTGNDSLIGGNGDDIFIVDAIGDHVVEDAVWGNDTVRASVGYSLPANVDNLVLTGTAAINGTGNTLANRITGNAAANVLNGGAGGDTMIGGLGNDIYVVDNTADVISETSTLATEIDTVQSSVSRSLGSNQERLVLTGTMAINGTGNTLANRITGNAAANVLNGGAGNDSLNGGGGNDTLIGAVTVTPFGAADIDTLTGGVGNDVFVLGVAIGVLCNDGTAGTVGTSGYALITDFTIGDKLQIKGAAAGYYLGAVPTGLPAGRALFLNDSVAPAADELIAIIQGPNATGALAGVVVL